MRVTSLGFQTDLALRVLEGAEVTDRGDYLVVRCHGYGGPYLERRARARRRLTQAGRAAWFGAFTGGRLLAQLGVCDAGGGLARYQDVETDPEARRRGLAGTLVWRAGLYAAEAFGAGTLVIVADPAESAIRIYRACGFGDKQGQFSFERASER